MATESVLRNLLLGTAGHIDHGKTSLIRALTGIDTDRLPDEKARGITIDIGFANLDLGDVHLGIIDVPGHERFVKNMLAGAAGIDLALLVIAADDSIMPQTREHLAILQMLDIRHGLIALTKTDLVDPEWLEVVEDDVRTFARDTFLQSAAIVRTAVAPGQAPQGCDELKRELRRLSLAVQPREPACVFRMPVDRAFAAHGVGTVVTGSVWSGELNGSDEVEWLPSCTPVRVRGLQSHGRDVSTVSRGQRAAANLSGVHHEEIVRGHELATPGYLKPSRRMLVEINVLAGSPFPIRHRGRYRLHLGTQERMTRVSLLEGTTLESGGTAIAQLLCAEHSTATSGQPFVLRLESPLVTLGGGHVIQPAPRRVVRRSRRSPELLDRLRALRSADPRERAAAAVCFFEADEWGELDLCRDAGLHLEPARRVLRELCDDGVIVDVDCGSRTQTLHRDVLLDLENAAIATLDELHDSNPLESAIARPLVAARLTRRCQPALVNAVLDRLIRQGRIGGDEQAVMLTKHAPKLTPQQAALRDKILAAYEEAGLAPPAANDLAATIGASAGDMRKLLNLCVDQKQLVHLGGGLYLTVAAEMTMRNKAVHALQEYAGGITMSQLRESLETSRKYAVPFAEYLDRIGVTKRSGDLRVLNEGRPQS
mgnify:CR=1 FL=1